MTRPTILDLDMAVTPRKSVPLPYDLQDDFCDDPSCEHGCAEMRQERDEFNRKHNGPDTAWDDVRKYVEGLERERDEATGTLRYCEKQWSDERGVMIDKFVYERNRAEAAEVRTEVAERQLSEISGHMDSECDSDSILHVVREAEADRDIYKDRADAAEARIAELEKKLSEADALIQSQQHDFAKNNIRNAENAHKVAELEKEKHAALTMIAMVEKRLADAERVIGDFMDITEPASIPAFKDPQYAYEVERMGERIGFGALIASASASWREVAKRNGHPDGGEFVVGPCMAVLQSVRRAASAYMEGK